MFLICGPKILNLLKALIFLKKKKIYTWQSLESIIQSFNFPKFDYVKAYYWTSTTLLFAKYETLFCCTKNAFSFAAILATLLRLFA